jgi:hypothetical protein
MVSTVCEANLSNIEISLKCIANLALEGSWKIAAELFRGKFCSHSAHSVQQFGNGCAMASFLRRSVLSR